MNELIAGIDLCDEYTQVSCGNEEKDMDIPNGGLPSQSGRHLVRGGRMPMRRR